MPAPDDDALREMARHRGLRLVKSRKRTPGVGDYGRYGLTDAKGAELFGFGKQGLTATAEELAEHLRSGDVSTWQRSVAATPAAARPPRPRARAVPPAPPPPPPKSKAAPARKPQAAPKATPPEQEREKEKPLSLRAATASDAAAIASLIEETRTTADAAAFGRRLTALRKTRGAAMVAQREAVIGCIAWTMIETLQHGPVGRITLLVVTDDERRQGLGRRLVEAAQDALGRAGAERIEVMSDITMRNNHSFFRKLGFDQASYRFTRPISR
jgi:N-acetylglutamate synthase-like GNAT family acetyltransferase